MWTGGNVKAFKVNVTLWNMHGHAIRAGKGIIHKNNNTGTSKAKAWKWFVTICAPLSPSLAFLSARIVGPDSQREIQFLLTAPCCPDRIYHLELELQPERQCTVDTSWTAPVTTLTNIRTHISIDMQTRSHTDMDKYVHTVHVHMYQQQWWMKHSDLLFKEKYKYHNIKIHQNEWRSLSKSKYY